MQYDNQDSLGEGFHTALRKCCESFASTIAYRTIRQLSFGWAWFLDELWKGRKEIREGGIAFCGKIGATLGKQRHDGVWLDGEPFLKLAKDREAYRIGTLLCALEHLEPDELVACLTWGSILKEE